MTFESTRIIRNVTKASPSSFAESTSPMPWVPRKYRSIRKMTPKISPQKKTPTVPSRKALNARPSPSGPG
jgi:hypothetical protein